MAENKGSDLRSVLEQLESALAVYFEEKAPSLPKEWKKLLVKIAPWLSLIFAIFALPTFLAVLGLGAIMMPFSYLGGMRYGAGFTFAWLFSLLIIIVELLAIPSLFQRKKYGWRLLFYVSLISALNSLLSFNLGALIVGTLFSWYILFQVREYYK